MIETLFCIVIAITDGDSLTCLDNKTNEQIRVRLIGIDAPERRQPFGTEAKAKLSELVLEKSAKLECHKTDQDERRICKVWVQPAECPDCVKTLDAGLAMLTVGMAWWDQKDANTLPQQERAAYEFAQTEAKAKKAGLWSDPDPVPPWDWQNPNLKLFDD